MSADQVALIPQCQECQRVWLPSDLDRWHTYGIRSGFDDWVAFWRPEGAVREFGEWR